jgi:hypothetical protein
MATKKFNKFSQILLFFFTWVGYTNLNPFRFVT